jgi:hypothetical protein
MNPDSGSIAHLAAKPFGDFGDNRLVNAFRSSHQSNNNSEASNNNNTIFVGCLVIAALCLSFLFHQGGTCGGSIGLAVEMQTTPHSVGSTEMNGASASAEQENPNVDPVAGVVLPQEELEQPPNIMDPAQQPDLIKLGNYFEFSSGAINLLRLLTQVCS